MVINIDQISCSCFWQSPYFWQLHVLSTLIFGLCIDDCLWQFEIVRFCEASFGRWLFWTCQGGPHDYIVWICEVAVICLGWISILDVNFQDFLNLYQGILDHIISKSSNVSWNSFTLFVGINSLYPVGRMLLCIGIGVTVEWCQVVLYWTGFIILMFRCTFSGRFLLTLNLSKHHLLMLFVELECRSTINQQYQILAFRAWLLASKRPSLLVSLRAKLMYVPSLIGLHYFVSLGLFSSMVLKIFLLPQPVLCNWWGLQNAQCCRSC